MVPWLSPYSGGGFIGDGSYGSEVIDHFQDNDLSEYSTLFNGSAIKTQSSVVYAGSYALQLTTSTSGDGGDTVSIGSQSGLPNYPAAGDVFRYRVYIEDGLATQFGFAYQGGGSANDGYKVRVNNGNGDQTLKLFDDTNTAIGSAIGLSIPNSTWLTVKIDWGSSGSITATLLDNGSKIADVSGTDSTYTSGGIAMNAYDSNTAGLTSYWDDIEII